MYFIVRSWSAPVVSCHVLILLLYRHYIFSNTESFSHTNQSIVNCEFLALRSVAPSHRRLFIESPLSSPSLSCRRTYSSSVIINSYHSDNAFYFYLFVCSVTSTIFDIHGLCKQWGRSGQQGLKRALTAALVYIGTPICCQHFTEKYSLNYPIGLYIFCSVTSGLLSLLLVRWVAEFYNNEKGGTKRAMVKQ